MRKHHTHNGPESPWKMRRNSAKHLCCCCENPNPNSMPFGRCVCVCGCESIYIRICGLKRVDLNDDEHLPCLEQRKRREHRTRFIGMMAYHGMAKHMRRRETRRDKIFYCGKSVRGTTTPIQVNNNNIHSNHHHQYCV